MSTDMTIAQIRETYLKFFEGKGHTRVASSPLVPQNDPTMMFTNSGMVQFKNVFTGAETRPYTRATTAQKCVRAGGKHNDLDNVGYTARHHTFFEMMGNFSFGDYFKQDAIAFAWELVTKHLQISADRLLATVHTSDEDAADIWKKVAGFSDSKIIRINTNDNFWMMGDTGPCGPCTELFFDQGDKLAGGPPGSTDQDGDRFLEFWNLVFMQYEQEPDGKGGHKRTPLPKPSIDTGMGLERASALIQGKFSNYDIDLMRAIITHIADLTGVNPDGPQSASHRVIADHLRSAAFLIAEGMLPGNEGRAYVLRRIMRRGMRHAHMLGARDPLMHRLFPTLLAQMGDVYPELKRAEPLIVETLKLEETRFKKTLETGLRLLDDETKTLHAGATFPGAVAFKLYDTYGFPLDLTQDALKAKDITVDQAAFDACMNDQRAASRKSWVGAGGAFTDKLWFDMLDQYGATDFLGYAKDTAQAQVQAIVKDNAAITTARAGDTVQIITNQTPFYGESGGQVGDTGVITTDTGFRAHVTDTQKILGKIHVHIATIETGTLTAGATVTMAIDTARRNDIRANHSVTHLLHQALHDTLGDHIAQKGSLQDADRTRFDISHNVALTDDQIARVEQLVNDEIRANTPVETRVMSTDDAMNSGAQALFGEKYGDEVRVLYMGRMRPDGTRPYSVELCGGTHVSRTGDIGLFKIVSQSAVSAGVRRIEGMTGRGALAYLNAVDAQMNDMALMLKTNRADVPTRVATLMDDRKKLDNEITALRRQIATGGTGGGASASNGTDAKDIGGVKFVGRVLDGFPARDLKPMVDDIKKKLGSGVVALISVDEGRASLVVGVTDDLTARFSAVDLAKLGAVILGGTGGGGRPDMAQAGGPTGTAANDAVGAIEKNLAG